MQGYKTFATLTRLEFPGQITAIVGPNGSGKSNIADGVRWVLGEQSYSLLRAKKTEDLIFSGSQQRSRAGMASTTITFDNQDGWLPIDYSEVAISRRAYRDGQNEYLLNGQKVRLKDISELLSQTGLSERTYTIIGQGLVDVALALKPDERRELFEEAAGIGLYRTRKEDALRRLENTRKNLDRILDIMTEIRPRLRSLERQASRFDEFQRLRSDLEVLLLEWYGYHWHQKQQDIRIVNNDYRDQESRLIALRKKHSETEQKADAARAQLQNNRKKLEEAHRELSEFHRELEQAARHLAIIEERQRSNNQQKNNLEIDIAHIQEEIIQLEAQEETYQSEIGSRLEAFEAATSEFELVEKALEEVSTNKAAKDMELTTIRNSRISLETNRVKTIARLEELNNRLNALDKEKVKIDDALTGLNGEQQRMKRQVDAMTQSFSTINEKKDSFHHKIQMKLEHLAKFIDEQRSLEDEISTHVTLQSKLQAQLEVLKQAEAALIGYSEGSKSLVEDSRKGRLPKGIEPLSKHIIVDETYEKAISAALGELTDLLILPSGDREVVIEYLESKNKDRVALIPLDNDRVQNGNPSIKNDGVFGFANELIKVDRKYRNIVDTLFSDILIVRDRKVARLVQPRLVGTMKAVTLNGLVFHANGIMISGNNTSGKRIGRTRQKNEMQQELEKLEQKLAKFSNQKEHLQKDIEDAQAEQEGLNKDFEEIELEENEARQALQESKDHHTRITEQISWHEERMDEIQKNIVSTRSEISMKEKEMGEFEKTITELHQKEKVLMDNIDTLPLFEMQQSLNHWKTHRIVTKNALETAKQRFYDHQIRIQETRDRFETYQNRLSELTNGITDTKNQNETLKEKVSAIDAKIREVESSKIEPLGEQTQQSETELSALEKMQDQSHKQIVIAERQFTQLELELSRRKDQLDNLRERIEDDFGLVSFDYEQKMDGPTPLPFEGGFVENLPRQQALSEDIEQNIKRLKSQIRRIGAINPEAQREYLEVKERHEFLTQQIDDLEKASGNLKEVIGTLDRLMERDFLKTFKAVDQEFSNYFFELFNGGEAKLVFIDEQNPIDGGVDILARLPGRRQQGLASLSGGERSLTAVALIFALLKVSPTPFCILDEVDAMLDESNVGRFIDLLRELSKKTQFVVITHNRNTVQAADVIYGVTMGRESTSQMISLKLEEVSEAYLE
jgi:chromosome segregation protein